jgi:hypothetical protein
VPRVRERKHSSNSIFDPTKKKKGKEEKTKKNKEKKSVMHSLLPRTPDTVDRRQTASRSKAETK